MNSFKSKVSSKVHHEDENEQTNPNQCGELSALSTTPPMSLIDQLRARRARIAADAKRTMQALDRQISLLEQSDAESIVNSGYRLLDDLQSGGM